MRGETLKRHTQIINREPSAKELSSGPPKLNVKVHNKLKLTRTCRFCAEDLHKCVSRASASGNRGHTPSIENARYGELEGNISIGAGKR